MAIDLKKLEVMLDTLFSDEAIEEKFWDWYVARNKSASTAKPNVELPRGVKLCDCPECGAEIQYGLAQDVIDKFNKVFGTKGAKPNVSGELPSDESKKCDYHAVFTFCGDNGVTYCSNCGDPL